MILQSNKIYNLTILRILLIPNFKDTTNTKNYNEEILLLGKHVKITKEQNIITKDFKTHYEH